MFSSSRRKIGVLLLAAVLTAPLTAAAEPRAHQQGTQAAWDLFSRLWSALTAVWGENGCSVDPFGRCGDNTTTPEPIESLDNGCKIDPFGGCEANNATTEIIENLDEGCKIDPFGGCRDNH